MFDPVLCELAYRWFAPRGGTVLDPFAGGSVRGVVAARLGLRYHGIDLRSEQITANREQWEEIRRISSTILVSDPVWYTGDSQGMDRLLPADLKADFVFSCPPYGDLEVYSDDPRDLSSMGLDGFRVGYRAIIAAAVARLKQDRFAAWVVGEYRVAGGGYAGLVPETIRAFEDAGARFYNEAILVTAVGSLPVRAGKPFEATRKLGKTHQNVLVFVKGDPVEATRQIGKVDFGSEF